MDLKKLKIIVEKSGGAGAQPAFDNTSYIEAQFNPKQLSFNKSANWAKQDAKQRDNPELQFTNSDPCTLTLDLFFDTYDTPDVDKEDVREQTKRVMNLMMVDGDKHRPPVCRLAWGAVGVFFQCVLTGLDQQFTLFLANGRPVRATLKCTFKEWWTNYDDINRQALQSADVVKARTVKRGDTLSSIAAEAYQNPALWRPIAIENGIDNPRELPPGTVLLIPTLPNQSPR